MTLAPLLEGTGSPFNACIDTTSSNNAYYEYQDGSDNGFVDDIAKQQFGDLNALLEANNDINKFKDIKAKKQPEKGK